MVPTSVKDSVAVLARLKYEVEYMAGRRLSGGGGGIYCLVNVLPQVYTGYGRFQVGEWGDLGRHWGSMQRTREQQ